MRRCLFLLSLAVLLVTWQTMFSAQAPLSEDEQLLKAARLPTDDKSLLQFFRFRTPNKQDLEKMAEWIARLNSDKFKDREEAAQELTLRGPAAVSSLREAVKDSPLEVRRRIDTILKSIETAQFGGTIGAAARVLAARHTPGAFEALFDFLPHAGEEWAEEEVIAALVQWALAPPHAQPLSQKGEGRVHPYLEAALKDKSALRRAWAVYVLGRSASWDQRQSVRQFLNDADDLVRRRAAEALAGKRAAAQFAERAEADAAFLKTHNIGADEPALLAFLRKRTLSEEDQNRLEQLVRELGNPSFAVRDRASRLLTKEGPPAIAFLKPALQDADLETSRRAARCLEEIRRGPGAALPAAAVRLLTQPPKSREHPSAAAVRVLLAYVPFADDDAVEDEVFAALTQLSVRGPALDPLLHEALRDPMPARRAAAAHVLGRVGTKDHRAGLQRLLDDPVQVVRLRAAQGLLSARDPAGVPKLIALVEEAPPELVWQIEETLYRLAGPKAPTETVGGGGPDNRQLVAKAWMEWWTAHSSRLDLSRYAEGDAPLGLITVCEYDSAQGQAGGQAWEAGRDGKTRWKLSLPQGPMDAQMLPNGRVLIAESNGRRVTERDLAGEIKWEYRPPGNPIAVQRLPNGNTFIATYNNVLEVTPDQKQVYVSNRGPNFYIFSARKLRNGNVVAMTAQGMVVEFDPITNKDIRTIQVAGATGNWCSVEALPGGRYLVATMSTNEVKEIDAQGSTLWTANIPGVFRATRLPNGNTLAASMTTRQVVEIDKTGQRRWEKTCEGRPWSVRYR